MSFAICLQIPNHIHFKQTYAIWAETLPQMLFLQSIFGYLVVCIIYKWTIDWTQASTQPPSLLNMLIQMFLSPGTVNPDEQLFSGQGTVQVMLLALAGVCVPWMLCAKPYILYREMKKIQEQGYGAIRSDEDYEHEEEGEVEGNANGHAMEQEGGDEEVVSSPFTSCFSN